VIQGESVGGGSSSGSTSQPSQFNWGTLGQGLQRTGQGFESQASHVPNVMTDRGQPASSQQSKPFDVNDQSQTIQPPKTDAEIQSFIDALHRLSAQGKSAASYMYVDPRAQQSQPQSGNMGALGLLPPETQPSF